MRLIIAALALLATPAIAQQAELEKARTEVNTVENAADRAFYACSRGQQPKCTDEARTAANAASRALYAIDKAIAARGPQPVRSALDADALLSPKSIPPGNAPDVVGAFRFLCGPGQIAYDDPIMYPGKPGASHLHQFFGNLAANGNSTYESLRLNGESTCNNALNRSAYWMPAMMSGKGSVVRPDRVAIYYKRRPSTDPVCKTQGDGCVGIPTGLRMIFGYDMLRAGEEQPENQTFGFKCADGNTPITPEFGDMRKPLEVCKPGMRLIATIHTPPCWDGRNLDAPDHRSHLARMERGAATGWVSKCPASHPKIIPVFTMSASFSIHPGDSPALWHLASDHMVPSAAPGSTFHSDYWEAWEPSIRLRWEAGCIDAFRNCSDGDLGDGAIMKRGPHYPSGVAKPRLVPVPVR